jgi:ATP-dependent DNA ligase
VVDFSGLGAVHLPLQPMNATLVPEPFDWPGWAYEEKYDGVRILAYKKEEGRVRLLSRNEKDRRVLLPSHRLASDGLEAFRIAKRRGYEGLVAKDLSSPYVEARSSKWLKVKVPQEDEFVIAGFTKPAGSRQYFGALLLGAYDRHGLRYVGKVGTGFDRRPLATLYRNFQLNVRSGAALSDPPLEKGVVFLAPRLIAQNPFQEWRADRKLRQPVFLGLPDDKRPLEVRYRICLYEEYQEGRICAKLTITVSHMDMASSS